MTIGESYDIAKSEELDYFDEKPKIGDYFGVITPIDKINLGYKDLIYYFPVTRVESEYEILLFKRISEDIIIEVSTGVPFLFVYDGKIVSSSTPEKLVKYRKIGLAIQEEDHYIITNDKFKKLYSKFANQDFKNRLKDYVKKAHENFEADLSDIVDEAHSIALVDNAIYDMEKKCKVKTLTKPNDDQK